MIVCLRTVRVPTDERARYLEWIEAGREVREAHGLLAEWVLDQAVDYQPITRYDVVGGYTSAPLPQELIR